MYLNYAIMLTTLCLPLLFHVCLQPLPYIVAALECGMLILTLQQHEERYLMRCGS